MFISSSIKVKARVILIFRLLLLALFLSSCSQQPHKKGFQLYQEGKFQEALPFLKESCLQKNVDACKLIALIHIKQTTPDSKEEFLQALNFACKYGDISSCYFVFEIYERLKLYPKAIEILKNACQWGDPVLCLKLGGYYFQGKGVAKNTQKSLEFWIKSCYGREKLGCELAISLLQKDDPSSLQISNLKKFLQSL